MKLLKLGQLFLLLMIQLDIEQMSTLIFFIADKKAVSIEGYFED